MNRGPLTVEIGGREPVFQQLGLTAERDLTTAVAIAVPITLLLLLLVFRSVVSALLPVLVGISAVIGARFVLFLATMFADVSTFTINLVTALALGFAIDCSLLIVSRFREERANGPEVDAAVRTAGRTVAFSGLTVAVSLATLPVFPLPILRSFDYAGIGVIGFAVLVSSLHYRPPSACSATVSRRDRSGGDRPGATASRCGAGPPTGSSITRGAI